MKAIKKYLYIQALGIMLYEIAHAYATHQRGYEAIGGEFIFWLLPVVYYIYQEFKQSNVEIKKILEAEEKLDNEADKQYNK